MKITSWLARGVGAVVPCVALGVSIALPSAQTAAPTPVPAPGQVFRTRRCMTSGSRSSPDSCIRTRWRSRPRATCSITERPGRLRIVRNGRCSPSRSPGCPRCSPWATAPRRRTAANRPGCATSCCIPQFATNRLLYLSYVKPGANGFGNLAVARGRFENDRLSDVQEIFHANAPGNGTNRSSMWGGRLAFDRQGYLFVTLGDRQWPAVRDL